MKARWRLYACALVASLTSLASGFNMGIIATALPLLIISLTFNQTAFLVSIVLLGAMLGSLLARSATQMIGHRNAMLITLLISVFSSCWCTVSVELWQLLVARLGLGISVGLSSVISTLYIADITPIHLQNSLLSINQLMSWMGVSLAYFIGYGILKVGDQLAGGTNEVVCWRLMFASGVTLTLLPIILTIVLMEESPTWLANKGRLLESAEVEQELYHKDQGSSTVSCIEPTSSMTLLKYPLFVNITLQVIRQLSGNGILLFYGALMLHSIGGLSPSNSLLFNALTSAPQIALLILAISCNFKNQGRQILLTVSQVGIIVSLIILGIATTSPSQNNEMKWWLVMGLLFHKCSFALGITADESHIPPSTYSIFMTNNWGINFAMVLGFPILLQYTDPVNIYFGLAVLSIIGLAFVWFVLPYTTLNDTKETVLDLEKCHNECGTVLVVVRSPTVHHIKTPFSPPNPYSLR